VPYSRVKVGMKLRLHDSLNLKVDNVCAVRGYYAACSGNFIATFRDNLSVPSSRVKKCNKKAWVSSSAKNRALFDFFLDFFILENVTDRLSRNVGKELPLLAA